MSMAGSIGDQLDNLEDHGTEYYDGDDETNGNALIGTGHPEDPTQNSSNFDINPFRDPTDWIQANAGIVAGVVAVIGVVAVVAGGVVDG